MGKCAIRPSSVSSSAHPGESRPTAASNAYARNLVPLTQVVRILRHDGVCASLVSVLVTTM